MDHGLGPGMAEWAAVELISLAALVLGIWTWVWNPGVYWGNNQQPDQVRRELKMLTKIWIIRDLEAGDNPPPIGTIKGDDVGKAQEEAARLHPETTVGLSLWKEVKAPEWTWLWSPDDAAECLEYQQEMRILGADPDALYAKLWRFVQRAKEESFQLPPLGGDGSDGTVEEPAIRLETMLEGVGASLAFWWDELTDLERRALDSAYKADFN